jgi:hypothetical protein
LPCGFISFDAWKVIAQIGAIDIDQLVVSISVQVCTPEHDSPHLVQQCAEPFHRFRILTGRIFFRLRRERTLIP